MVVRLSAFRATARTRGGVSPSVAVMCSSSVESLLLQCLQPVSKKGRLDRASVLPCFRPGRC